MFHGPWKTLNIAPLLFSTRTIPLDMATADVGGADCCSNNNLEG
jgi:hypothetical protein